jgi:hypothetical protein
MGYKTHPHGHYTPSCAIFHYYQITNIIFVPTEKGQLREEDRNPSLLLAGGFFSGFINTYYLKENVAMLSGKFDTSCRENRSLQPYSGLG